MQGGSEQAEWGLTAVYNQPEKHWVGQTYSRHIGTHFVARHLAYKIDTIDLRREKEEGLRYNFSVI